MKKSSWVLMAVCAAGLLVGCSSPMKETVFIQLGMTPQEVSDEMGRPYSVRSAKVFENEETTMIWEYWPPFFSANQAKVHVYFENGQVVQWGLPGDFNTGSRGKVSEYKNQKGGR